MLRTAPSAAAGADQDKDKEKEKEKGPAAPLTSRDEIVPCDCVLIRGKAVVNEASLTGERVVGVCACAVGMPVHCALCTWWWLLV